jgi:hypothetical protein
VDSARSRRRRDSAASFQQRRDRGDDAVALRTTKKIWEVQSHALVRLRPGKTTISRMHITATMTGPATRPSRVSQQPRKKRSAKVTDAIAPQPMKKESIASPIPATSATPATIRHVVGTTAPY